MNDFTKDPQQIIVDMLNAANGTTLRVDQLSFGVPTVNSAADAKRNTRLVIAGVPAQGVEGSIEVQYNRVAIDTVPGVRLRDFSEVTSRAELVAAINARYAINITNSDCDLVGPMLDYNTPVSLPMLDSSLIFTGALQLQVSGETEDLSNLIIRDTFTGEALALDTAADVGVWSDISDVIAGPWMQDGAGALVPGGDLTADRGGYLHSQVLSTTEVGYALEMKFEITDPAPAGQFLSLRLAQFDAVVSFLVRINLQHDDSVTGLPYGSFDCTHTVVENGTPVTHISDQVALNSAFASMMTAGEHTFRMEIAPGRWVALIDGAEVGVMDSHSYMPPTPTLEVFYQASTGAPAWKLLSVKAQGYTPADYAAPAPILQGTFSETGFVTLDSLFGELQKSTANISVEVNGVTTFSDPYGPIDWYMYWEGTVTAGDAFTIRAMNKDLISQIDIQEGNHPIAGPITLAADFFKGYKRLQEVLMYGPTLYAPGALPLVNHLQELISLEMYDLQRTGALPSFDNMAALKKVDLTYNQLSGALPNFTNTPVTTVYLDGNQLTDFTGSLPATLADLRLTGNPLTQVAVDNIIAALLAAGNVTGWRSLNLLNTAVPSAAGLVNLQKLVDLGWQVQADGFVAGTALSGWITTLDSPVLDRTNDVVISRDGGAFVTGYMDSNGGDGPDVFVAKLDATGAVQWQRKAAGVGNTVDSGFAVAIDAIDRGVYVAVRNDFGNAVLMKFSETGALLWQKQFTGIHNHFFNFIVRAKSAGGVYYGRVVGEQLEGGATGTNDDAVLTSLDRDGNIVWQRGLGGGGLHHSLFGMSVSKNGNVVIAGNCNFNGTDFGSKDAYVACYSSTGVLLWQRIISDEVNTSQDSYAVATDGSNNIYVMGHTDSEGPQPILYLIKFDVLGEVQWQRARALPGVTSDWPTLYGAAGLYASAQGEVYIAASGPADGTVGDTYLAAALKYDTAGNLVWQRAVRSTDATAWHDAYAARPDDHGGYFLASNFDHSGSVKAMVAKFPDDGSLTGTYLGGQLVYEALNSDDAPVSLTVAEGTLAEVVVNHTLSAAALTVAEAGLVVANTPVVAP